MNFSAIDKFTHLTDFGSSNMPAEGIRILSKVGTLHNLLLFFSEVNSLQPFMNMTELNSLNIYGAQLTNLDGISAFRKLTYLEVTSNAIDDLSALIGNATIARLKLSYNPVKDLSPLDHMPALKTVILSGGQETNFTRPISELPFAIEYYN